MALSHPAMRRTDRLFQIIDPAACAIARPQTPGDLELTPRTFGTRKWRKAPHRISIVSGAVLGSPSIAKNCSVSPLAKEIISTTNQTTRELRSLGHPLVAVTIIFLRALTTLLAAAEKGAQAVGDADPYL